jgi:putative aldouronate transport system substrate-binding protein
MKDARTKFIMGELDEQGWKKQVDTWLSRGGQKIIDEYSAAYAKSKAKPSK